MPNLNFAELISIELMEVIQHSFDYDDLENPIGERRKDALRVNFDRKLKLGFHGVKVTSDAGLLAYRELDEEPSKNPRRFDF